MNNQKYEKMLTKQESATTAIRTTSAANLGTYGNLPQDEEACVVCFKSVNIYSVGECDHPVCYECSTRMRVLCQQNECPICRQVLAKVIFTYDKLPYRELEAKNRSEFYNKKYKIGFYTKAIQQAFNQLLEHPCPKCDTPPYRTFQGLRNHVQKVHDLFFCDLCVEHLKIFTFERRCYTSAELRIHRINGDADNRSHRGHPLCEYCNKRFLDRDEQFRHLRREHYFCHFCEADGINDFYRDYAALADHFRQDHFLCEEGKCATEQFIGAFRTEIDFKAHIANVHSKSLNKQQAKQTRTLQLEITLGPRGRAGQSEANLRSRSALDEPYEEIIESNTPNSGRSIAIDANNVEDFPSLGGGQAPNLPLMRPPPLLYRSSVAGLARTKENFPALGNGNLNGSLRPPQSKQNGPPISSVLKKTPISAAASNATGSSVARNLEPGPPLPPPAAASTSSGMVLHVSNRPTSSTTNNNTTKKSTNFDFPALPDNTNKTSSKKIGVRALLEEDMGKAAESSLPLNTVSAKHRILVDDYVSFANPRYQKIQMVEKEEEQREQERKQAPKLNNEEFPTLSGKSDTSNVKSNVNGSWVRVTSDKKQREVENRNNKIAAMPVLTNHNNNNKNIKATLNKKEKKQKEKEKKAEPQQAQLKEKSKKDPDNNEPGLAPPPGFSNNLNGTIKPPPGFHSNVTVKSVAKPANNLTFTSSLGQTYSIVPQHMYIKPPNQLKRAQKLDKTLWNDLDGDSLTQFFKSSSMFREDAIKAPDYYDHCRGVLRDKFDKIFPEFLALLPDISKQQALYLEHRQRLNNMSPSERKSLPRLEVCGTCKQVLIASDLDNHKKMHETASAR